MRIYVAAKWEERARARAFMTRIEEEGHTVTHDWTKEDEAKADAAGLYYRECAAADVRGAAAADAVVLLFHPGLQGGLVELGIALGVGLPVVLVGAPPDHRCIFYRLCEQVATEDQALLLVGHMSDQRDHARDLISAEILDEAKAARDRWPPMQSAHEGFAVLREEVDELWRHVMVNQKMRDLSAMRREAVQIGAMALRFVEDVVDGGRGRK
jgi:hypothetical protein